MKLNAVYSDLTKQKSGTLVISVFENRQYSNATVLLDKMSNGKIAQIIEQEDFTGKAGQNILLYNMEGLVAKRVLIMGCGAKKTFLGKNLASRVKQVLAILDKKGGHSVLFDFAVNFKNTHKMERACQQIAMTAIDRLYHSDHCKSKPQSASKIKMLKVWIPAEFKKAAQNALNIGKIIAEGKSFTKKLADLPGNICTPSYLAEQAVSLAKTSPKLKTQILDEAEMKTLGMDSLLSVSRGSRQEAKLIIMRYQGASIDDQPIVLVGKGLTFDAGGISIKPSPKMDEMKYDMCGGASVFGVIQNCIKMNLPLNVIGVVPSSENLPDGDANKPGDIVTSMSGQTIEILNTDAEGRLILCDALTYVERFKPKYVIDIATLTGACIVALGDKASALMSNRRKLVKKIQKASKQSGDRVWELPLWDDYDKQLKSNFADMANIGGPGAGSITAGCFLARYTKKYAWAHLDIAGTAWQGGVNKGATARPVELLTTFLQQQVK